MAKAELDKYYTPDEVIRVCEEKLQKVFKGSISCIIDPCAGDGRWKDSFKRVCQDVVLYDIEPDSEDVSTRDFLKDDESVSSFLDAMKTQYDQNGGVFQGYVMSQADVAFRAYKD